MIFLQNSYTRSIAYYKLENLDIPEIPTYNTQRNTVVYTLFTREVRRTVVGVVGVVGGGVVLPFPLHP